MRESFERNVRGYNEVAKDRLEGALTPEEEGYLDGELNSKLRRAVNSRYSDIGSQERVYELQEEKQGIMQKLKERIADLDNEEAVPERRADERMVIMEDDNFVVKSDSGRDDAIITKGELLTDMDWDVYYYLDPATVHRAVRKKYLIEDAKHSIWSKLNEQIITDESSSMRNGEFLRNTYSKIGEREEMDSGLLAEKLVRNFLKKISIDYDVDFEVIEADVFQDVNQKIDFIIKRKRHTRGVEIEETETENVGVQFTISRTKEILDKKKQQIANAKAYLEEGEIEDLVLVSLPIGSAKRLYENWLDAGSPPGGPDKLMASHMKKDIFYGVMKDILTPQEIEEQWNVIAFNGENKGNASFPKAA